MSTSVPKRITLTKHLRWWRRRTILKSSQTPSPTTESQVNKNNGRWQSIRPVEERHAAVEVEGAFLCFSENYRNGDRMSTSVPKLLTLPKNLRWSENNDPWIWSNSISSDRVSNFSQEDDAPMLQSYLASGARIATIGCDWFRMGSDWFNPSINLKPHSHQIFRRHLHWIVCGVLRFAQTDEISEIIGGFSFLHECFPSAPLPPNQNVVKTTSRGP